MCLHAKQQVGVAQSSYVYIYMCVQRREMLLNIVTDYVWSNVSLQYELDVIQTLGQSLRNTTPLFPPSIRIFINRLIN